MYRCSWCEGSDQYIQYHDIDWGVPVHDDNKHFEYLILEGAQAGLSWLTILKRRDTYRKAYDDFDPELVAHYNEAKIQELLKDPGIIRNKLKVRASVNNANLFLKIQKEFGSFDKYIWGFTNGRTIKNSWKTLSEIPAKTELSDTISLDLQKRGFKFTGSTIIYAHLQAAGIVNDHLTTCFRYDKV
ncbi:MAG: DNA-3-methyladenine glycosylase I [Spirochaetaceae bacterium]|nr:DNA-3-methyladenine glycosylase I [Spirochaetaceae bacterium]